MSAIETDRQCTNPGQCVLVRTDKTRAQASTGSAEISARDRQIEGFGHGHTVNRQRGQQCRKVKLFRERRKNCRGTRAGDNSIRSVARGRTHSRRRRVADTRGRR